MRRSRLFDVPFALVFSVLSSVSNASLVVPDGLSPGDKYHVIFVSSTSRDSSSSNISDYDAHVQAAAEAAGIGASAGIDWLAVGSTPTLDAIDHLSPLSTSDAPVYNQNGDLVASSFTALWGGTIQNAINYTEAGVLEQPTATPWVWTGTASDGTGDIDQELGGIDFFHVTVGSFERTDSQWITSGSLRQSLEWRVYGLSEEITISSVPVPAAVWLFGSGLLGLVGIARSKKTA
jgi:hypothetical protein